MEVVVTMDLSFYSNKTVFITGHTGFKGSWMCKILLLYGAKVIGYALEPQTEPNLFEYIKNDPNLISIIGDIRDLKLLKSTLNKYNPEIVIHMAAQPLVRDSYQNPVYTYDVNVMGTVNILEAVRENDQVKSFINVTTDKVYYNNEWEWGYRENDVLNGFDPYSNSKSCSELVTSSYKKSFFKYNDIAISRLRAGNVIGGGDFAKDRIIPDCVRAMQNKEKIVIRNPYSTRPYQHVLEPVCAYLMIAKRQIENVSLQGSYNIGPNDEDCVTTQTLVELFCKHWGGDSDWVSNVDRNAPHEACFLKLDCSKVKKIFKWEPRWSINEAIKYTVEFSRQFIFGDKEHIVDLMDEQIKTYLNSI